MPALNRWRAFAGAGVAGAVLVLFWVVMVASVARSSLTVDEPGQAVSGAAYWAYNDYRLDPENGNLPQRLMALPLLSQTLPDNGAPEWAQSQPLYLGARWFFGMGHPFESMAWEGRAVCALLATATGALVYLWGRRLFGALGAMLALLLFVLNPTVLANGPLMTSDMASALFFLLAVLAAWKATFRVSPLSAALAGLAVGGLFVSKPSAFLVVPMVAILWAIRAAAGPVPEIAFGTARAPKSPVGRAGLFALSGLAQALVALAVIWAFYGFRYGAFSPQLSGGRFEHSWDEMLGAAPAAGQPDLRGLPARIIDACRTHHLFPEAFLYGQAHTLKFTALRSAFLNGEFSLTGWRAFFPYTFLAKTPFELLLLIGLAAFAFVRRPKLDAIPLLVLIAVYAVAAIASPINIGHRHLLALYPPLLILCGGAGLFFEEGFRASFPAARPLGWAVGGLLLAAVVTAGWTYPHYLSYFSPLTGGRATAYQHLVDSSLDWGQDLPDLRDYLAERRASSEVHLAYFGTSSPVAYGIHGTLIFGYPGTDVTPDVDVLEYPEDEARQKIGDYLQRHPEYQPVGGGKRPDGTVRILILKTAQALRLTPGTYAISATLLQPVMYDLMGPVGPWNHRYEDLYQRLSADAKPLMSDDPAERQAALRARPPSQWKMLLGYFEAYRFARLTAYLRHREPEHSVNGTILIYEVTQADLTAALEAPPPELGPDEVVRAGFKPTPLPFSY